VRGDAAVRVFLESLGWFLRGEAWMKPTLLRGFRVLLPRYHRPQEEGFAWLAAAHARSDATASGRENAFEESCLRMERLVRRFGCSARHIGWRRSELGDFMHTDWHRMLIFNLYERPEGQSLGCRNRFFAEIANRTLERFFAGEHDPPSELLHVTCTGYASPSPIQRLIELKQWHSHTRATQIYHMGCYAAIPALRVAAGLLQTAQNGARPRAEIVHTELCTLHFDPRDHSPEQLVVQSLFADGHVRYAMTPDHSPGDDAALRILSAHEESVPGSLDDMTWVLSESGFRMTLSPDVPAKIAAALPGFLTRLFAGAGENYETLRDRSIFAIHPGGPKIIDSIQELLCLSDAQIAFSRSVLYEHGNMSSATLPHIWARVNTDPAVRSDTPIVSLAFGPGLTIAGALFKKC
jgi:predicted naringenin-chalcone synthase